MSRHKTFVERVLDGEVLDLATIDDDIAAWHQAETAMSLPAWLGLSDDEYAVFAERAEALRVILAARRYRQDFRELLQSSSRDAAALAARGATPDDLRRVREWLEKTGRI